MSAVQEKPVAVLPEPGLRRRPLRVTVLFAVLVAGLLAVALVSAAAGQYGIPVPDVLGSILHRIGIGSAPAGMDSYAEGTLWQVRFPRVVLSLIVGGVLGVCGALMQGVFGNPLAEPGVVGVSSGAAVGACLSIVGGWTFLGTFTTPALAFATGLATVLTVYLLARSKGRTEVVTLILTGVAVNAVAGAAIAFLVFLGDQSAREQIVFWQLGSMASSRWPYVYTVAPLAVASVLVALVLARKLDLLSLGDRQARHVGVNVESLRLTAVLVVAVAVSAAVSYSGIIGFVGLVVPHLIRMIAGPGHRVLLPASALGGAVLLSLADLLARTLFPFADLPIGILTALVGGPFFFVLLLRTRKSSGGWA
ncbi:iron ABC transporter permease [Amycolatopsis rubida]|uniref:Iron ABC transporter permease n=1 Tax=Amycolatopsis rubida TaxID=112413 RepID=A0A1I6AP20_9PSEU|nr:MULTISPECIES: iron ABC transporter permease [Amycolatopsis]MYW89958.1 iron chelate uptake ABC transporter family permease subunit [Amycolatopsis rubida]NEC54935.1 iron ABC transporter permease [Amycolatopsis rubida]OAP20246.1 Hemin transport system permease protein HmuU [Amycolatopsis sp. M39]SFQ70389.1 iron complex transport system permease protein [Amycolatopsis rubida]